MKTKETKHITLVPDFFNKVVGSLDKEYFPEVRFYRDSEQDIKVHYAVECFSNGVLTYTKLINILAKNCNDTKENIHKRVSKYVLDFGSFEYKTN